MKAVRPVPARHKPKGVTILYEDEEILVVDKSAGLLTVRAHYEKEKTAHQVLTTYIRRGNARSHKQLFVVHRLDRETSGVLVFAKSFHTMEQLKRQWRSASKIYLAAVHGLMEEKKGTITSYLAENEEYEVFSVDDPAKGKLAITAYRVIREKAGMSLLEIELLTGRKNQIRVHLAEKGHPVVNDEKYGRRRAHGQLALHSRTLSFTHPATGKRVTFEAALPPWLTSLFPEA